MKNQPLSADPVLEVAWRKFAQFDLAADARSKAYMRLRKWIALLGVLMAHEWVTICHKQDQPQFALHAGAAMAGALLPLDAGIGGAGGVKLGLQREACRHADLVADAQLHLDRQPQP